MSIRTRTALHQAGFRCLRDVLVRMPVVDNLMNLPKLGKYSVKEIKQLLDGLDTPEAQLYKELGSAELSKVMVARLEVAYARMCEQAGALVSTIRKQYPEAMDFHEGVVYGCNSLLQISERLPAESLRRVRMLYIEAIAAILEAWSLWQKHPMWQLYRLRHTELSERCDELLLTDRLYYPASEQEEQKLQSLYNELSFQLCFNKGFKLDSRFPSYKQIIPFIGCDPLALQGLQKNLSYRHAEVLFELIDTFVSLVTGSLDNQLPIDFRSWEPYAKYMNEEEKQFVMAYCKEHCHMPLFFLLVCLLKSTDSDGYWVFRLVNGIDRCDFLSYAEVANLTQLDPLRIKELVELTRNSNRFQQCLDTEKLLRGYPQFNYMNFMAEGTVDYHVFLEKEHVKGGFHQFASLLECTQHWRFYEIEGRELLVPYKSPGAKTLNKWVERYGALSQFADAHFCAMDFGSLFKEIAPERREFAAGFLRFWAQLVGGPVPTDVTEVAT